MTPATPAPVHVDDAPLARAQAAFAPHAGPDGARFERPMHVRLLHRRA